VSTKVLVVDDDEMMRKLVSQVVARQGMEVILASDGLEAVQLAAEQRPDLILMDVMMPNMDGFQACRRIRKNPDTAFIPIILLTAVDTLEQKVNGFEAGADDYLAKPFEPKELLARSLALLRRYAQIHTEALTAKQGKVIAVFSLRGGVGVSTISANLACGLAQVWGQPAALVDMVMTAGQSALLFNLSLRNTWADLARFPIGEIDQDLVHSLLRPHESGVHVLAAPSRPEEGELVNAEKVAHVLRLLRQQYNYIVLDLPHDFSETTLAGLDEADEIFVLLSPDLASVRAAALTIGTFENLGYAQEKFSLVLNWTFERRGLARKDIEHALKREIKAVLPFAPEPIVQAINTGVPLLVAEPESPMSAIFEDWAFRISKSEDKKTRPQNPTAAWMRIARRLQQRAKN